MVVQAGLPTAEEQADAAFEDLLRTSYLAGPQSTETEGTVDAAVDRAVGEQSDNSWTKAKSRGALWEAQQLFNALTGGAHIVRRKDGSV